VLDGSTQLKALEGIAGSSNTWERPGGEMILISSKRSIVHVPSKAGAFDERDGSSEGSVHPMLAKVDATPDVVGVVAKAGGEAEVAARAVDIPDLRAILTQFQLIG